MESEFGKGLVICLVKFAEHFEGDLFTESKLEMDESRQVEMWANGASDHLYEIEVPQGKEWARIRKEVKQLQDKGLEIGHGFTGKQWTAEDRMELERLTESIALMIDRKLGLKPDIGEW